MSLNEIISKLTPEQKALIPVYREKWRKIALSTERIDRDKAAEAVKEAYAWFGEKEPEVLIFDSPYAAIRELDDRYLDLKRFSLRTDIRHPLLKYENKQRHNSTQVQERTPLEQEILQLVLEIRNNLYVQLEEELDRQNINIPDECFVGCIQLDLLNPECSFYDFCISVLNRAYNPKKWQILQDIVMNCGWIFEYVNICIVCDRPTKLLFDNQNRLHAEAEPAIEYADGFKVYAHHGVWLPEKYGKIPIQQWQAQWLLEEPNAELRRVLIQVIGYERICQELQAIELDTWAEYTLIEIDNNIDIEPILLLKMTCPSTGHIHILRVPLNMTSAREAIRWVNWGIDPEEFAVQT